MLLELGVLSTKFYGHNKGRDSEFGNVQERFLDERWSLERQYGLD